MINPLGPEPALFLGPVAISRTVATTWALMAVLAGGSAWVTRRLEAQPGRVQAAVELLVEGIARQVEEASRVPGTRLLPIVGTLFLFILAANLSAALPGIHAPTARLETTAALALVVLMAAPVLGMRALGARRYFARYLKPTPILLPLTLMSELTRTLSLAVRLFGNIMSHELMIAIVLALAGLLVPVPVMALGLLVGAVQAYIFAILAAVFLGAAVGGEGH